MLSLNRKGERKEKGRTGRERGKPEEGKGSLDLWVIRVTLRVHENKFSGKKVKLHLHILYSFTQFSLKPFKLLIEINKLFTLYHTTL